MLKPLIALYFFVLAAIQFGLLIGLFHYHRSRNLVRPSPYWMGSLIANITALFVFGFGVIFVDDVSRPAFNFTIANTLFYVAAIFQWLFCKSLSQTVSSRFDLMTKLSIVIFFVVFELLRHYANFEIRTAYMVGLALLLFGSQIHQLSLIRKVNSSPQLTYLQYATIVELSFAVCRLIVLAVGSLAIQRVEQLPQALIFFTIAQLVANTVAYIAIGSYWTEKMALSSAAFSNENEVIKKLLLERDELIASLLKANKTAATGALSASIAHELNQPITAISLNTEFLKLKMDKGVESSSEIRDVILNIEHDNQRISRIVSTLRNIFKQDQAELTPVNLNDLIQDLMPIVTPQAKDCGIQIYLKNNNAPKYDQQSLDEYMELFKKFKLKVTEAEALGYDTLPKLKKELEKKKLDAQNLQIAIKKLIEAEIKRKLEESMKIAKEKAEKNAKVEKEKAEKETKGGFKEDDRFWKPTFDQEKLVGSAVIRPMPAPDGEEFPYAKVYSYSFKGKQKYYIENSLTTIGKKDPLADLNARLWNSGIESDKDISRKQKRRTTYIMNVLIVKDPARPEL
mgnify:CR=1 FL=1